MSSLGEFSQAMSNLRSSMREFGVSKATAAATDQLTEIDATVKDEADKFARKRSLANDLSARLLGMGARADQVAQASAIFSPKQYASVQEMALEGVQTANPELLATAEKAQKVLEKTGTERFNAELQLKRDGLQLDRERLGAEKVKTNDPTDAQSKAASFVRRAQQAELELEEVMADPEKKGLGFNPVTLTPSGFVGVPKRLQSKGFQKFESAKLAWATAVLRDESGAAIGEHELASELKKYFPEPGEAPEQIRAKADRRAQALATLEARAGSEAMNRAPLIEPSSPFFKVKKIDTALANPKLTPENRKFLTQMRERFDQEK